MSRSIDQHTEIDQRIRDFVDRKSSPWYTFGQTIIDKLGGAVTITNRNADATEIGYEPLNWKKVTSR